MTHSARARCANFLNTRDDSSLFFCSPWGLKTVLKQQQQFDAQIPIFSKFEFFTIDKPEGKKPGKKPSKPSTPEGWSDWKPEMTLGIFI